MLASDWRNPADSLDVDSDLSISPLDVLSVVNRINGDPSQELAPNRPVNANYFDVDGDQRVGPLDVLMLVNYINSRGSGPRILRDVPNKLSDEASIVVNLRQSSGSRLIQLEITPTLAGNNTNGRLNKRTGILLLLASSFWGRIFVLRKNIGSVLWETNL